MKIADAWNQSVHKGIQTPTVVYLFQFSEPENDTEVLWDEKLYGGTDPLTSD